MVTCLIADLPMHPFIWSADTVMCEVEQGLDISEHDSKA